MKAKTIQKMSLIVPIHSEVGYDRYNHNEPFRSLLKELIDRGEISRFRGDEVSVAFEPDCTVIEMVWNSRKGAEDYAKGIRDLDPTCEIVFSVEVRDVIS